MAKETAPVAPVSLNVTKGTFLGYQEFTSSTSNKTTLFEVYVTDAGAIVNSLAGDETLAEGTKRTLVRTSKDGKSYWNAILPCKPKLTPVSAPSLDHV